MFKETTGIITWMSNPAQPSFVWQLYHYDLEPNAALYGAKKAAETVHVQLNEINRGIEVVNNRPEDLKQLKVEVSIYRFDGTRDSHDGYTVAAAPASTTIKVAQLEVSARITPLYFIKLDLTDAEGKLLSTNLYWQHVAQDQFDGLMGLPVVRLDAQASAQTVEDNTTIAIMLRNNSSHIALLTHLQLHQKKSGRRVLPVFYSNNYISLVPGEAAAVTIEASTKDLQGDEPLVEVDGYNVDVNPVNGQVGVALNLNAQPEHWPESKIVP
jgi:beta-mannosidase